ncbi:MAG: histidinol-phosphate transaminase [Clostridia bacterium]|nr:histidinol-phosphate transaminase [Clostridia bacterium]
MRRSIENLIPYNPGKSLEELERELGKPVIKLSANESLWGPSPKVEEYLRGIFNNLMYYPDGAVTELKTTLASYWKLHSNNFCVGNGTDEIISLLFAAYLNPGDEVIVPLPTFSSYELSATVYDAKIKFIKQEDLVFNLSEIEKQMNKKTKRVFLCNPNNPTGTYFTHKELEAFLELVSSETLVILDEAYCHYSTTPDFPCAKEILKKYNNVIVLRTFSKVYALAALRVGYGVASSHIIGELEKVRSPFNVNSMAQVAAKIALEDENYTNKIIKETVKEREWLTKELKAMGLIVLPSQSNFVMVKITNAQLIADKLLNEGILVRNMSSFDLPEWLRISVAPHKYMQQLIACFKEIIEQ